MHVWDLVLKFYDMKHGEQFNSTPARKLSQSFNLDIVGSSTISSKQVAFIFLISNLCWNDILKNSYKILSGPDLLGVV